MTDKRYNAGNNSHMHMSAKANGESGREIGSDQAERLKALEAENARLKNELAILTVHNLILDEVAEENARESTG
jgi:hypothetical protein